jgi:hypothetical protein
MHSFCPVVREDRISACWLVTGNRLVYYKKLEKYRRTMSTTYININKVEHVPNWWRVGGGGEKSTITISFRK